MPKGPTGMPMMQDPTEWFCHVVGIVDNAWDVAHVDVPNFLPFLNGEKLDVDVARPFGGDTRVDHVDGRHIILVYGRGFRLGKS